jgi:hypothetical protein
MDEAAEECQRAFGVVCSFIGTRDLMQEHIAFRVWPLVDNWEMPKETVKETDEGGLIRLKYTFKYGDKFVEPDDDWLKSIENVSDELLGAYTKAENTALSAAFGGRKKKRLNRVFDAIGFIYPDYYYPMRGQKRKNTSSAKDTASAASGEPAPKRKKVKVLTHPPRCIEPAIVPEFIGEASSATEAREPTTTPKSEENHLRAVKRIMRYLVYTPKFGLWYPKGSTFDLIGYSDADWEGCKIDRKSTSGTCQFLGRSLVSWASKKQNFIALSSAEDEYIAAGHCCVQLIWMRQTLRDYGYKLSKVPLPCDNESAICMADNPVEHSRTKHIDIRYHFLRDHQQRGISK